MKEPIERNQQNRNPFHRTATPTDEQSQYQKATKPHFLSKFARPLALIGIVAVILATAFVVRPFPATRSAHAAGSVGFHISGRNLLDVNGNNFILRGISHGYAWYLSQNSSFPNIKATGANTIRVVLNGSTSLSSVQTAINLCKSNKLVCVLEDHDTTGYTGGSSGTLAQAVSYWESLQSILTGQENWVIINIGNEAWGSTNTSGWINATKNAIISMRNAGFKHTLMVDGPGWGQDDDHTMLYNAPSVEAVDSMHNTIFSVHMYNVYANPSTVDSYISSFYNTGLPFVVGEFGSTQSGAASSDAADEIMYDTQSRGIGYMGWSWSGNGGTAAYLDMVINFNPGQRSAWGNRIISGTNGIQQTAHECSCYGSGGGGGGGGGGSSFTPTSGAHYKLVNRNSGEVLDVVNKSTVNGGTIDQWTDSGTTNQQWSFVASNGGFKLINVNSGLLLDNPGGSTSTGTQLDQWNDTSGSNQWWNVTSAGSGYYYLVNQSSGLYVDVTGASTTAGANVIQWSGPGGNNQQWSIVQVSGGGGFNPTSGTRYHIVNRNSGLLLDIYGNSTANGGVADQWANNGGTNQDWTFVATNGGYKIINANSGLLLDNPGGSTSTGTQLDQWNDTSGTNQWWNVKSAGNGYYTLVNQSSGLTADVSGASTANGGAVIQWTGSGSNNQQWSIVPA